MRVLNRLPKVTEQMQVLPIKCARHSSRSKWLEIFFFSLNCRQFAIVTNLFATTSSSPSPPTPKSTPWCQRIKCNTNRIEKILAVVMKDDSSNNKTIFFSGVSFHAFVLSKHWNRAKKSPLEFHRNEGRTVFLPRHQHQHPPEYRLSNTLVVIKRSEIWMLPFEPDHANRNQNPKWSWKMIHFFLFSNFFFLFLFQKQQNLAVPRSTAAATKWSSTSSSSPRSTSPRSFGSFSGKMKIWKLNFREKMEVVFRDCCLND